MSVCWYALSGNRVVSTVVYQATVSTKTETKNKVLVARKGRHYNHNHDFRNIKRSHSTSFEDYILTQKLKDEENDIKIEWSINKMCNKYKP